MDVEQFASDSSSPVQLRKVMAGVAVVSCSCAAVKLTAPMYHEEEHLVNVTWTQNKQIM